MKIIITAGDSYKDRSIHPALAPCANGIWLDEHIRSLKSLSAEVVVVLSGDISEEIVRSSGELAKCELVFDASDRHDDQFSNLRAGLSVVNNCAWFLPVCQPLASRELFDKTLESYHKQGSDSAVHMVMPAGNQAINFPLWITPVGKNFISQQRDINQLNDNRLSVCQVGNPEALTSQVNESIRKRGLAL